MCASAINTERLQVNFAIGIRLRRIGPEFLSDQVNFFLFVPSSQFVHPASFIAFLKLYY
jgi:hypothetical protein